MPDVFSKKKRSYVMSRIRSKNTKPELRLKDALSGTYLRYQPKMFASPDFASKKYKVAVFVDGDFWHGYNWKRLGKKPPKGFWRKKIERNIARDKKYSRKLRREGWVVLRFWEHQVLKRLEVCAKKVRNKLWLRKIRYNAP